MGDEKGLDSVLYVIEKLLKNKDVIQLYSSHEYSLCKQIPSHISKVTANRTVVALGQRGKLKEMDIFYKRARLAGVEVSIITNSC
jgi:DNA-binding MurR/RpiR family transcriptional regulator